MRPVFNRRRGRDFRELNQSAFSVQMRALATGSDSLAEIVDDELSILLPKMLNSATREKVARQIEPMLAGESTFAKFARTLLDDMPKFPAPALRKNHWALV